MDMTSIIFRCRWPVIAGMAALGLQVAGAGTLAERPPAAAIAGFGTPVASGALDGYRGGFDMVKNDMALSGAVSDNAAVDVRTGSNFVGQGAFNNASGLPTVIQNSGANVLIQNATIINIQYQ
jgi:hypothetical protein